jgi:hypothetical protein
VVEEGLDRYITCNTEVKEAIWKEDISKWELRVAKLDGDGQSIKMWKEECDYFVNTTGFLKYISRIREL